MKLYTLRKRIIELKLQGKSDEVIANDVSRSLETIKYHWRKMAELFGVKTVIQVCLVAVQLGRVESPLNAANDDDYLPKLRA